MSDAVFDDRVPAMVDPGLPASVFDGRYLSLTSFRRDGTEVATPVWFVQRDGQLLVLTDASSYKVRRIRGNPTVRVALCTASGRLRGQPVAGRAELLPEAAIPEVEHLIAAKYRIDVLLIRPVRWLQRILHLGRPRTGSVVLSITPM